MKQVVAFAVVAGLVVGQATPALGCTVVISDELYQPTPQDITRYRAECRDLRTHRRANMRRVERGELDDFDVLDLADHYLRTEYGCPGDAVFAFDLVEAAVPDPIPPTYDNRAILARLTQGLGANGHRLSPERVQSIEKANWLIGGLPFPNLHYAPSAAEIDAMLADPQQRALVIEHRSQDRAMLAALSDPARPGFDRQTYASLVVRGYSTNGDRGALVSAAGMLLDAAHGEPDADAARRVLSHGYFSPYVHHGDPELEAEAIGLWRQIGEHLSESDDPVERAFGEGLAATGDPQVALRIPIDLPANAQVVDEWPEELEAPVWQTDLAWWQRVLGQIGYYPNRALRLEEVGLVETALHYGPDGNLVGFTVLRSSGSLTLDEATVRAWTRYFRPRPLPSLPAEMIDGHDLFIRMPNVEYHLETTDNGGDQSAAAQLPDGNVIVTGRYRQQPDFDSGCAF